MYIVSQLCLHLRLQRETLNQSMFLRVLTNGTQEEDAHELKL